MQLKFSNLNRRRIITLFVGFIALIWFLIRVVPKPSRAFYPCQRAAFPIASAFVIWIISITATTFSIIWIKKFFTKKKFIRSFVVSALLVGLSILTVQLFPTSTPARSINKVLYGKFPAKELKSHQIIEDNFAQAEATVGVIQSDRSNASDISDSEVFDMVKKAVDRAGGFTELLKNAQTVVLKPNLIDAYDQTASNQVLSKKVNGIATDYRVIQAVVDLIHEIESSCKVYVMEGSGVGGTTENMGLLGWDNIENVEEIIALENACGDWFDTSSDKLSNVSLPEGKNLYSMANNVYYLNKLYHEADILISIPVLKNHFITGITGAVKNVGIGATPPTVYGFGPDYPDPYGRWGGENGIDHGGAYSERTELHSWIHDYYMCRPADYAIMDGLQGVENGPQCAQWINNSQNIADDQHNMGLILASADPIAMDAVASLIVGIDPLKVAHLTSLHNDSVGCCNPDLININGIQVGDVKKSFQLGDSGNRSKYEDFIAPLPVLELMTLHENSLALKFSETTDISRIDLFDGEEFLDNIRISEFEEFSFELDAQNITLLDDVSLYVYDQFLNYSIYTSKNALATSINTNNQPNKLFSVHPNPAKNIVKVKLDGAYQQKVKIELFDTRGALTKIVLKENIEETFEVNISDIQQGNYLMRISLKDRTYTTKIAKQ